MEFIIPKFIERELRIVGPLTFRQFVFLAIVGAVCFFIYLIYRPFFWPALILLGGPSLALTFIKIRGRPLTVILINFFKFFLAPKSYIWKLKKVPFTFTEMKKLRKEVGLEIGGKSELRKIKTEVETIKKK